MVMAGGVALLIATSYVRDQADDPGLTTEAALLAAPLLGGIAMSDPPLASGLGVILSIAAAWASTALTIFH